MSSLMRRCPVTCTAPSSLHELVERSRALLEHVLEALVVVQEAARHELRRRHRVAALGVDGDDGDEDAVAGQLLAVAKHEALGVAELEAVDEHHARGHLVDDLAVLGVELEDVAVLEDEDVLVADAGLTRELGMEVLHAGTRRAPARSTAAAARLSIMRMSSWAAWPLTWTPLSAP